VRKRPATAEPPWGTIKRWADQGDLRLRGPQPGSTALRGRTRADSSQRVLHSLGGRTRLEALAGDGLCTALRGRQHSPASLPANPRLLAL
jgi:hypothetical protein